MPPQQLTILQMNDSHGYLDLHQELFWSGNQARYRLAGGYARIATLMQQVRRERPGAVLAFDCGDTIHGTFVPVHTRGQALVPILSALRLDAWTAHWDYAYGPQRLRELASQLPYPMLACNCYDKDTGRLTFAPTTVCEAAGLRVGVIGIAATIVDKTMPPHFSDGVYLTLGKDELPGHIARLRGEERCDLIVVVSHLGFPQEVKLASEVSGIDVLLSGHTHNRLFQPVLVNSTIVIQSGSHASFLGRLDLDVDGGRIVGMGHELMVVDASVLPDPNVQHLVTRALDPCAAELSQVVGHTATPLNRATVLEATMDNLLLQALQHATGAPVAFSNGWRYGAPIPRGSITLNDLYNIIPMNPPVAVVDLSGDEMRTMMEESLERTFARDPYEQMGGYVKRCLGINCYVRIENPAGNRIQEMFVSGEHVRPDRLYRAAFVTTQGVPTNYGINRHSLDINAVAAIRRYLAENHAVQADLHNSIVAI